MKNVVCMSTMLLLLLVVSGCGEKNVTRSPLQESVLIVGTESNFQPYSFKENNELVGFDIDVIKEVARRLGKQIEFKDMNFEALIPQAQLGTIHIIAAGMTPMPERAKIVDFTEPYIKGDPLFVVTLLDAEVKDFNDLKNGKKVVVNQGYTSDFFMSKVDNIELIRLDTPAEAFLSLKQRRADAFVTSRNTMTPFFKKHDAEGFESKVIDGTDESVALIVSKHYPDLLKAVQEVLDEMEKDSTMEHLKKKWGLDA